MALYDMPAPAKLNLFLHVVGRRADGYHDLQTVFRFVDLYDRLDFDARADGLVSCDNPALDEAGDDDLIIRAARALRRVTGVRAGVHVVCRKHIPVGGGLGGGSTDAATTLIALNRLWNCGLSRAALMRIGLSLGADVPAFLFGQSAFAEGVGADLTAVALPERVYVVAQPYQAIPTQAVFAAPELTRNTACVTIAVFADWQRRSNAALFGRNDLEPVACAMYPAVGQLAKWFRQCGIKARMTGSGACFFAEFVSMDQALECQREITAKASSDSGAGASVIKNSWLCQGLVEHPLLHWMSR